MRDHRVILLECLQHRSQVRVCSCDGGEQETVLAAVVAVEGNAETMAIQQEVPSNRGRVVASTSLSRDSQRRSQLLVHMNQFLAPGHQPGRLGVSHARWESVTAASPTPSVRRLHD
jgi:hypothetical protein